MLNVNVTFRVLCLPPLAIQAWCYICMRFLYHLFHFVVARTEPTGRECFHSYRWQTRALRFYDTVKSDGSCESSLTAPMRYHGVLSTRDYFLPIVNPPFIIDGVPWWPKKTARASRARTTNSNFKIQIVYFGSKQRFFIFFLTARASAKIIIPKTKKNAPQEW